MPYPVLLVETINIALQLECPQTLPLYNRVIAWILLCSPLWIPLDSTTGIGAEDFLAIYPPHDSAGQNREPQSLVTRR